MVVLLAMLALAMMVTGLAAVLFGAPIVQVERGWTMVIAGSAWGAGGAVLLGVALAAQKLTRIGRTLDDMRDRIASLGEVAAEQVAAVVPGRAIAATFGAEVAETVPPPAETEYRPPAEAPERVVVGQYASGGNSYTMYADGSIDADTPAGRRRFASIDELRSFVAAGGESVG